MNLRSCCRDAEKRAAAIAKAQKLEQERSSAGAASGDRETQQSGRDTGQSASLYSDRNSRTQTGEYCFLGPQVCSPYIAPTEIREHKRQKLSSVQFGFPSWYEMEPLFHTTQMFVAQVTMSGTILFRTSTLDVFKRYWYNSRTAVTQQG